MKRSVYYLPAGLIAGVGAFFVLYALWGTVGLFCHGSWVCSHPDQFGVGPFVVGILLFFLAGLAAILTFVILMAARAASAFARSTRTEMAALTPDLPPVPLGEAFATQPSQRVATRSNFDMGELADQARRVKKQDRMRGFGIGALALGFIGLLFAIAGVPTGPLVFDAAVVVIPIGALGIFAMALSGRKPLPNIVSLQVGEEYLDLTFDSGDRVRLKWSDPEFDVRVKDFKDHLGRIQGGADLRFWLAMSKGKQVFSPVSRNAAVSLVIMGKARGLTVDHFYRWALERGGSRTWDTRLHWGLTPRGAFGGPSSGLSLIETGSTESHL